MNNPLFQMVPRWSFAATYERCVTICAERGQSVYNGVKNSATMTLTISSQDTEGNIFPSLFIEYEVTQRNEEHKRFPVYL